MLPALNVQISSWAYASSVISMAFFIAVVFLFFRITSDKRPGILHCAIISALADLIPACIILAFSANNSIKLNSLYLFHGVHYAFAFSLLLDTFSRIIAQNKGDGTFLVFIGYIWMVVTIALSLAATIIMESDSFMYSDVEFSSVYNILLVQVYSIWGFLVIFIFLYFMNIDQLNLKTQRSIGTYILLVFIASIVTTLIVNVVIPEESIIPTSFFLVDLPIKFAVIIAAYYGPAWAENLSETDRVKDSTGSNDFEAYGRSNDV